MNGYRDGVEFLEDLSPLLSSGFLLPTITRGHLPSLPVLP